LGSAPAHRRAGEYAYSITCSGPGGTGSTADPERGELRAAGPRHHFQRPAHPHPAGGSSTVTWTATIRHLATPAAGPQEMVERLESTLSSGTSVGPITTSGTYTYTLTCSGNAETTSQNGHSGCEQQPSPPRSQRN